MVNVTDTSIISIIRLKAKELMLYKSIPYSDALNIAAQEFGYSDYLDFLLYLREISNDS